MTTDAAGDTKGQTYNNLGSQDSATDGLGNTTHYAYDGMGRLIRVTLPNGETTSYTYDGNGNVLTMTDAAGNVTAYEYDYRNLLIRLIRAGGRTGEPGSYTYDFSRITSYTYTADGRVSTVTDRNGAVTICVYDIHGNLLSKTVTEGAVSQSISYTYDSNGNVLTMTDGTGMTTRTYDTWNRTTAKTVPDIGTSFYTYDITDGFDAGCSAESTVDPKGNVTVKVYDRVGRLIYVLADSMTTAYAYYDDGSLQSVVYGNGSREDYTYTADKLLKTLVNKAIDGTIIDSYEYTYDAAHNLLSKTDSKGVTGYTYDAQNRLLTVTEPSGKITAYTYDSAGNRSSQTETEGTDVTATVYTYDALNRLLRTSESLNGTLSRTVDYTYDNNGNLLTVTSITYTDGIAGAPVLEQNNTYDLLNQLIRTVTSDGTTVENTYNGDGYRVVKSVNGSATRFLYQYDKIVLELNALGDQTGRNVYGLNLISRTFGEDTFFYFYNGHADVTALLASDGTIAATYYYDAFGNILDQTGTATSNILYAGYQYDPETGLYYLNARMYDPVTARFIQEDSYLGSRNDVLSLNLYTYCHNEPMMYNDPTGHKPSPPKGSTGGMPSEVYNKMYTYKPGEATAEYYQEKQKETKKGLAEKAISSGNGGMPTFVINMQKDLAIINEFLTPLPKTDQIAISKMMLYADEPYRSVMIASISSGNYKLVDTSNLGKDKLKFFYIPGEIHVDFTNLANEGYYPYISFFHELGHAIDNDGKYGKASEDMDLTTIVQEEMGNLLYNQITFAYMQYLHRGSTDSSYLSLVSSEPFLRDEMIDSIYNNVNDPNNNDVTITTPLDDRQTEILTIAANNMSYLKDDKHSSAWDMMGALTNTYTFTNAKGIKTSLGGGHGVNKDPTLTEGFYFYSYLNNDPSQPLILNDNPGNDCFAEYFATMASAPYSWKGSIQSTLPSTAAAIDDYLVNKYNT